MSREENARMTDAERAVLEYLEEPKTRLSVAWAHAEIGKQSTDAPDAFVRENAHIAADRLAGLLRRIEAL